MARSFPARSAALFFTMTLILLALCVPVSRAVALPAGFSEQVVAEWPESQVTAMSALPTGELVCGLRDGRVFIFNPDNGPGAIPFWQFTVASALETGVIGIAVDPNYIDTRKIYFCYTESRAGISHITVATLRSLTTNISLADPTSYEEIYTINSSGQFLHWGGGLLFMQDGTLLLSLGDTGNVALPQDINSMRGKVLRMMPDGSVPADNPIENSHVYALGFRNPYRMTYDPYFDRIFVSNVGQDDWEELELLEPLANYGWPIIDGPLSENPGQTPPENFREPYVYYAHWSGSMRSRALVGTVFYTGQSFPAMYRNDHYLLSYDLDRGQIFRIERDEAGNISSQSIFTVTAEPPVDAVELNGDLYYCTAPESVFFSNPVGRVVRIRYTNNAAPTIQVSTSLTTGPAPLAVLFTSNVTDENIATLQFSWDFGDGQFDTGKDAFHVYENPGVYNTTVTVSDEYGATASATIPVQATSEEIVSIGTAIYDVSSGSKQPFNGLLRLYAPGIEAPLHELIILTGNGQFTPLQLNVPGNELFVEISGGNIAPLTKHLRTSNGVFEFTGMVYVSSHAVFGTVKTTRGAPIENAPFDLDHVTINGRSPLAYFGNSAGHGVTGTDGGYYIPLTELDAGKSIELSLFNTGHPTYGSASSQFTAPLDTGLQNNITVGLFDGGIGCDEPIASGALVDFSQIQAIFNSACLGCHGPVQPYHSLSLSPGFAFGQLIGRESIGAPGVLLVEPASPERSYLVEKLNCANVQAGTHMPVGNVLPMQQRQLITDWISGLNFDAQTTMSIELWADRDTGTSPMAVNLRAGVTGGTPPYSVVWELGDGHIVEGHEINYAYVSGSNPTTFTLMLHVQDSGSPAQSATSSRLITLNPPSATGPAPVAEFTVVTPPALSGNNVHFSAHESASPGATILRYEWDFDSDGILDHISLSPGASYVFPHDGDWNVRLTVYDTLNASGSVTRAVTVRRGAGVTGVTGFNAYQ